MLEFSYALATFESEILVSVLYFVIHRAKKKYFTQQKLFEVLSWIFITTVPAIAAIPVVFAIFPQNPHFILVPFWIGLGVWLLTASKAELNKDERPHRVKILRNMGLTLFLIAIFAHVLLMLLTGKPTIQ